MKKDNKNKQTITETELNSLATKIVSRMIKLKTMEEWYSHIYNSTEAMEQEDLNLPEEVEALGEAARLMTIMNICQDNEEYEKCTIIKNRMNEVNKILKKYK